VIEKITVETKVETKLDLAEETSKLLRKVTSLSSVMSGAGSYTSMPVVNDNVLAIGPNAFASVSNGDVIVIFRAKGDWLGI
jgi:hypothetical protein